MSASSATTNAIACTLKSKWRAFGGILAKYTHASEVTKTPMNFNLYMPPQAEQKAVPVVYFLSGLTCNEDNFIQKAGALRAAAKYGLAIVAPDTSPRGLNIAGDCDSWDFGVSAGFYVNATEPKWATNYRMYDYVTVELPSLIRENFSVTNQQSIFGHSMGGHGAMICFLKNPGMYKSVSAFSPICNPIECAWGQKAFSGYLGENKEAWKAYDATHLLRTYDGTKAPILIDQGTEDDFLHKKQLLPENFAAVANECGYPVNLRMQVGYDHSYFFISTFIDDHIRHHAQAFGLDV